MALEALIGEDREDIPRVSDQGPCRRLLTRCKASRTHSEATDGNAD